MKFLNLASGASHLVTPQIISEKTMNALQAGNTFYGEDAGSERLRNAISKRYSEDYPAVVPAENILITSGTKHGLFSLFALLLKPHDEVIIPKPSWFGFPGLIATAGANTVFLETSPADNYALDPEKLESLITDKTRLFILSNPNNPIGRIYTKAELAPLLSCLQKYPDIKIISDEIYDQVLYENAEMPSLAEFPEMQNQGIIVNGFSKNFAMSGWRIGYIICPQDLHQKLLDFQHTTISGVNPFIQEGAVAALENRKMITAEILKGFNRNREIICNWLTKHPEISFSKPGGAYYIFADFRNLLKRTFFQENGIDSTQKLNDYLKEHLQLEFVPGERFVMPGFMRITFAVSDADLSEALRRLDTLLLN